jgi:hypothetical protein
VSAWLLALALSVGLVALSYAPALRDGGRVWLPALLRGVGALLLAAAAFDAPLGRAGAPAPLVALDASASWTRAAAGDALAAARDSATRAAPGAVLLAGDSLRGGDPRGAGSDAASRAADAVDRAAAAGRPLVYVTDGEADDAAALARAPRGSRAVVVRPARGADAALADADAPRAAAARDTVELRATVAADAAGAGAGEVTAGVGGRVLARTPVAALAPYGRREVRLRVPLAGAAPGPAALTLAVRAAGDREPRNDTLALALDVTDAPAAVFVSGAPDYDARFLLGVLRGALALPVRAYLRVAPGQWRAEGTLAAVPEAEVRAAAARASLLVLHGDTLVLGAPRALGRGALALVAPPAAGAEPGAEWYAAGAPPSPVAGALAGVAWDSLPPLDAGAAPAGEWQALVARAGRRGPPRAVVAGSDAARRTLVAGAGGFWRWQFRGGRTADAAAALWGGLFDWLAAGRGDERQALPERAAVRAGEPVRWRRTGADSVVRLTLAGRGAPARTDTLTLRFSAGARVAESPALPAGIYDVRAPGGPAVLAVNASAELLPRRPTVVAGPLGGGAPAVGEAPRVRESGWPFAAAALVFCAEWVLRRRRGLR